MRRLIFSGVLCACFALALAGPALGQSPFAWWKSEQFRKDLGLTAGKTAAGHGKARKFPRATVEAIVTNRARGCGPETVNHYVRAVRGFFRWLVKAKRIGSKMPGSFELKWFSKMRSRAARVSSSCS